MSMRGEQTKVRYDANVPNLPGGKMRVQIISRWKTPKFRLNWWLLKHGLKGSPYPKWMYQITENVGKALKEAGKKARRLHENNKLQ